MSVTNACTMGSAYVGSYLFKDVFNQNMAPLIWVSTLFTCMCLVLMPLLKNVKPQQED